METAAPARRDVVVAEWPRRIALIRRAAVIVSLVSVVADGITLGWGGRAGGIYVALVVAAAGAVLSLTRPLWSLLLVVAACAGGVAIGAVDVTTLWSVVVFTLLSVTLKGLAPWRSGFLVGITLYVLLRIENGGGWLSPVAITAGTAALAAAAIGAAVRAQWRYQVVLEQRAQDALAVRQRDGEQALVEERLRIARDLHDLVGHEVALLNMHLGVAEVSLPPGAGRTASALTAARVAVQSILSETQQILELLRRHDAEALTEGRPAPGPDDVARLVESFRRIGLDVEADLGSLGGCDLTPAVGLTVYRVVQEALTNAHRHGDGEAQVSVTQAGGTLVVSVTNRRSSDPAQTPGRTGFGLQGMQERVTSVRGALEVDSDGERFTVSATLPTIGGTSR